MRPLRFRSLWWLCTGLVTGSALIALLVPPRHVPDFSASDYTKHLAGFFLLSLWYFGLFARQRWHHIMLALCLLAVGTEIMQHLTQLGRQGSWLDGLANVIGISVALGAAHAGAHRWPDLCEWILSKLWPRPTDH